MRDKAVVGVGVEGGDAAKREFEKIGEAGKKAGADIDNAFKKLGQSVAAFASNVVDAVVDVKTLDPGQLVRTFEDYSRSLTKTSIATGQSLDGLKVKYMDLARANSVMPQQIDAFAKSMGRMTYDIRGAQDAFTGLHNASLAVGDSEQEWIPFGVQLKNIRGISGDTTAAVGKLFAQAEKLGTVGGPRALRDLFTDIGPAIDSIVTRLGMAREKAFAFAGALTAGLPKQQASRVAQGALSVFGDFAGIQRTLGYDPLDRHGHYVKPPQQILQELYDLAIKSRESGGRGLSGERLLQAFRSTLGPEAGSEVYYGLKEGRFRGVSALAGMGPSGLPAAAGAAYRNSGIGAVDAMRLGVFEREMALVGEPLFNFKSSIAGFVSEHPFLSLGAAATAKTVLSRAIPSLISGLGSSAVGRGAAGMGLRALGGMGQVAAGPLGLLAGALIAEPTGQGETSNVPLAELIKGRAMTGQTGKPVDEALYGQRAEDVRVGEKALRARGVDPGKLDVATLAEALKQALESATVKVEMQDTPAANVEEDKSPEGRN